MVGRETMTDGDRYLFPRRWVEAIDQTPIFGAER
jgi:hypothetical protein